MGLRAIVERYLVIAGGFGPAAPLAAFGLTRAETEQLFSTLDEDYQISRFFQFSRLEGDGYSINGFPQTHITMDAAIQTIL